MDFSLFIAKRYLVSKKTYNIINIISIIAIVGITFATMSLFVILSIFNGMEKLIDKQITSFNPDLRIELKKGKYFQITDSLKQILSSSKNVAYYSFVLEENVVLGYDKKQVVATMLGVDSNFVYVTGLDSSIYEGRFVLKKNPNSYAVIGSILADQLGITTQSYYLLTIWAIKKVKAANLNLQNAFNSDFLQVAGIFMVNDEYDSKYVIVPLDFAQDLTNNKNLASYIYLKLYPNASIKSTKKELSSLLPDNYEIKDKYQQNEMIYKIMKSEKWAIFAILSFIIFITSFNIIGSLVMLILEKKKDISVLFSLGASEQSIRRIFLYEGLLISFIGAVVGLILGLILCVIQIKFGLITLPSQGSFITNVYPVSIKFTDAVLVFFTVMAIGYLIALYPVRYITFRLFNVYELS